jgi:PAS domain S-box-containing protein
MLKVNKPANADFLADGGEMGALTRSFDWAASPLGPPDGWPQSLRTAVRILLNTNHPMFIWWGPELIQFYNDAYRQTMGPERHPSALGQRGRECWAEIWDIIGPQIEQVMSGGGATWHENQLVPVTRHGRLEQVYWTYGYSPIDEDDGIGGVLVVCRDVTKDYLASVALREREAELARVQRLGRIGGLEVDLTTGFRNRRSPEYLQIHGLPPDSVHESHEDWVRRIHPEDREATEKKFRDAVAGNVREYSVQYRIIRPSDGETRWISVTSTIERDPEGKAIRLVGAHSDVTERVVADMALRQSEEQFRKLADELAELNATLAQRVEEKTRERDRIWNVSQDLLVVADRNGVWRTVNPAWTKTLGWSEAELLNRTSEWLEHPDDGGTTRAEIGKLGAAETTVRFESRFRHKDGSYRWLSWTGVADRDSIYAVARDVTAEKAAAERL